MTDSTVVETNRVDDLIEGSSFGTPGARSLRERTSPTVARRLANRAARHDLTGRAGGEISNELYPLIEPAKHGDRDAIDAMFKHLRPVFFRYCRARLGRPFSTPDGIAEEVFVQVFAALPDYEDPPALFLKSVYQRAFAAVDEVQSQALSGIPNGPEAPPQMTQLLNRLSKLQREVTVLRIVVGLDARDTALLLDISAPGVRSAQHRAITRLRKLIEIEDVSLPA